jgi:hypothetical protein
MRTDQMQMMEASEVLAEYHLQVLPVHNHRKHRQQSMQRKNNK